VDCNQDASFDPLDGVADRESGEERMRRDG
jgi:hypothetical protein